MKRYKLFLILFLVFSFTCGLFAAPKVNNVKQSGKKKDTNSAAYLSLEEDLSKQYPYKVTGNVEKDKKYNEKVAKYIKQERERLERIKRAQENSTVYDVTSLETRINTGKKDKKTSKVDDREIKYPKKSSLKSSLTKYQKAQLDYLEMERKSKILVIDKELNYRKKLLDEELANEIQDAFIIEEISREIKMLTADIETVNINVDKKIRYVLDSEQYMTYKKNKNKKNKEK
ncbi:MAG: hypothetical protein J6T23_02025 [Elusimicrobia bacterium]|nr:hypothetical protein [Elusimicrobiota bacterium]